MNLSLSDLILPLADRDDLAEAMAEFYEDVDRRVAERRPTCWNRGLCCKFGKYGHRLYVTSVELAYFVRGNRDRWRSPTEDAACPYQVDGLCTARDHRPMGCRVFFCDSAAQDWQPDESERNMLRLKALSATLEVDYRYVEWLSALRELDAEIPCRKLLLNPPVADSPPPRQSVDPTPLAVIQ